MSNVNGAWIRSLTNGSDVSELSRAMWDDFRSPRILCHLRACNFKLSIITITHISNLYMESNDTGKAKEERTQYI